jgi:hypothetical protein
MKTYKEAIWQLAISKAHSFYGGDMMPRADGAETVAWIFDVSADQVYADIAAEYEAACSKVCNG